MQGYLNSEVILKAFREALRRMSTAELLTHLRWSLDDAEVELRALAGPAENPLCGNKKPHISRRMVFGGHPISIR